VVWRYVVALERIQSYRLQIVTFVRCEMQQHSSRNFNAQKRYWFQTIIWLDCWHAKQSDTRYREVVFIHTGPPLDATRSSLGSLISARMPQMVKEGGLVFEPILQPTPSLSPTPTPFLRSVHICLYRRRVQHHSDRSTERLRGKVVSKLCPNDARVAVWPRDFTPDHSDLRTLNLPLCSVHEGDFLAQVESGCLWIIHALEFEKTRVGVGVALAALVT